MISSWWFPTDVVYGSASALTAPISGGAGHVVHLAARELPDLGDVLGDPLATQDVVDPALLADVGRHAAELPRPLSHLAQDLRHVLRADHDDGHDDEDDELAEAEAEHAVNLAGRKAPR